MMTLRRRPLAGRPFQTWAAATGKAQQTVLEHQLDGESINFITPVHRQRWTEFDSVRYRRYRLLTHQLSQKRCHNSSLSEGRLQHAVLSSQVFSGLISSTLTQQRARDVVWTGTSYFGWTVLTLRRSVWKSSAPPNNLNCQLSNSLYRLRSRIKQETHQQMRERTWTFFTTTSYAH